MPEWIKRFSKISSIIIDEPKTWEGRIFLTVDIDYSIDEVTHFTLDMIEKTNVEATFFTTHNTSLNKRILANPLFELGLHPNFNPLLEGNGSCSAMEVACKTKSLNPNAVSIRSHSLTQSSKLLKIFYNMGLTHECNLYFPIGCGATCRPIQHISGLVSVPTCWSDYGDMILAESIDVMSVLDCSPMAVYTFHPIHIMLNSSNINDYEKVKIFYHDYDKLRIRQRKGIGARTKLEKLLSGR